MHVHTLKKKSGAVVLHAFNLSAKEAGAGGFLSLRPGQPGITQRNLISKRQKKEKRIKKKTKPQSPQY